MGSERDRYTDCFKGTLILWVIHIHTVFWTGELYIPEIVRQASLLIDVPAFFFISGYLVRPSDRARLFRKPVRQFLRLYGLYLVVSFLLLLFSWAGTRLVTGSFSLPASAFTSMLKVNPDGPPWRFIRIYGPSLWFMRDYLSLLVFVPLVIGLAGHRRARLFLAALLLLLVALIPSQGWDHPFLFSSTLAVAFYLFIFQLGSLYRIEEHRITAGHLMISLTASLVLSVAAFHLDGNRLLLQENKFPPTFRYLFYSLPLVHLFALGKRVRIRPEGAVLSRATDLFAWCGKNVFLIYLFQCAVCSLPYNFLPFLIGRLPPFPLYVLILTFNIALTLLVALLYKKLEALLLSAAGRQ